ncbi:hypothetical protein D9M68_771780 [compost metagenome]
MPELLEQLHPGGLDCLDQTSQGFDTRVIGKRKGERGGTVYRDTFKDCEANASPSALQVIVDMGIVHRAS